MARKFVVSIDLNKNELLNARIQNLSAAPSSPVAGQVYFDTTTNVLYFYDGTDWVSTSGSPEVIQDTVGAMVYGSGDVKAAYDDSNAKLEIYLRPSGANAGSYGSTTKIPTFTVNGQGILTQAGEVDVATTLSLSIDGNSAGSIDMLTQSLGFYAGQGINISPSSPYGALFISAEDASNTNKGIASFKSPTFSVDSGEVDLVAFNHNIDANGNTITELADPVNPGDAANKRYVDAAVSGLEWKQAVNLLDSTPTDWSGFIGAGSFATLPDIDDHATLNDSNIGYRILLTGQLDSSNNGIYEVVAGDLFGVKIVRPSDADNFEELKGVAVFVMEGANYGTTAWVQTNHYITTFQGQQWVQFSGAGAYTAGDGMTQNGVTFNVVGGNGITVKPDKIEVDAAVVARKFTQLIGDGLTTTYTVQHNLGNQWVNAQVYEGGNLVEADITLTTENKIDVSFATPPSLEQFRVVITG